MPVTLLSSSTFNGKTNASAIARALLCSAVLLLYACGTNPTNTTTDNINPSDLLTVDCLLPPQVRQLGSDISYLSPRIAIRTSGAQCALRGGEYVAHDRADFRSALAVWLPLAQEGDPEAQTYVGEIHEKGMGTPASHELAAYWYQRAVEQNYSRAQINLGYLYESGLGVERDLTRALNLYRQAAGFTAAELEFVSPKIAAQRKADSKKTEALQQTAILTSRALKTATVEIDSLNEQISNLQARLTQTPADPEPLLKQNDQQQELDKLRSEMDKLKSEHTQKTGMLETLKLELASAQAQLESTSGSIAQTSLRSANAQRNQPTQQTSGQATAQLTENAPNQSVAPTVSNAAYSDIAFGNYHALVIGNDTYRSVGNLQTAGNDAIAVEQIFREKYGFNTFLLLNANQRTLLSALERMRLTLGPQDNLVVYYAGHGELDEISGKGYWLPTDAELHSKDKWIGNDTITAIIDSMTAKHVLVIADSCYSGTLTQASVAKALVKADANIKVKWTTAMSQARVRTVLSSGGVRPVIDSTPGSKHSIFAARFLDVLKHNTTVLEGYELFYQVQKHVADAASALDTYQIPRYAPMQHAGHQAGEFFFVPASIEKYR